MRRNHVAIRPPALLSEPFQEAGCIGNFTSRLGQWLALFQRHQRGQILLMFQQQVKPAPQNHRPRLRRLRSPTGQHRIRRDNRPAGFPCAQFRNLTEPLPCRWIDNLHNIALISVDPGTIDITLLTKQSIIAKFHQILPLNNGPLTTDHGLLTINH